MKIKVEKIEEKKNRFGNNPIYLSTFIHLDKHLDRARGTLGIKFTKNWLFLCNHFNWSHLAQNFFKFHAWVKKCILAIFQKSADWLDWPCPVKGQLISEWLFDVFIWTKKRTKIFLYFCPALEYSIIPKSQRKYFHNFCPSI